MNTAKGRRQGYVQRPKKNLNSKNHEAIVLRKLWISYDKDKSNTTLRNQLFEKYRHLAERKAKYFARTCGLKSSTSNYDDFLSAAYKGLMDSIEAFDIKRASAFGTFCHQRINGEIIDELRRLQPFPRDIAPTRRWIDKQVWGISHDLCCKPNHEDILEALSECDGFLNNSIDKILSNDLVFVNVFNELEVRHEDEEQELRMDSLYHNGKLNLTGSISKKRNSPQERKELIRLINKIVDDKMERKIILCYFFWDMTVPEISKTLDIGTAWVSEKKNLAINKLAEFCKESDLLLDYLL